MKRHLVYEDGVSRGYILNGEDNNGLSTTIPDVVPKVQGTSELVMEQIGDDPEVCHLLFFCYFGKMRLTNM